MDARVEGDNNNIYWGWREEVITQCVEGGVNHRYCCRGRRWSKQGFYNKQLYFLAKNVLFSSNQLCFQPYGTGEEESITHTV